MSRILSGSVWGLAIAAIAAFSAIPASAASFGDGGSAHIVLVRGGGGGGGGRGGGGGGGGNFGGNFSSGGRSFASPSFSSGARSFSSPSVSNGARSFSQGNFANGNRANFNSGVNYAHNGWNNGNWAWRGGNGYGYGRYGYGYGGWGWGYPWLGLGLGAWWYPGYYYGYDYGPYYNYYGDDYYDNGGVPQQYTAAEAQPNPPNQMAAEQGQGSQYLDEAVQSFQSGDYQNAMRNAEHAVIDSPKNTEAHEVIALSAFALKDYRTAATEAHAVVALGGVPSWDQVYAIYQNVDTYASQLRALENYVKANPKSPEGQFLLGVMYLSTGYTADAHDHLVAAAKLTPKDQLAQELVKGAGGQVPATANRPSGPETK